MMDDGGRPTLAGRAVLPVRRGRAAGGAAEETEDGGHYVVQAGNCCFLATVYLLKEPQMLNCLGSLRAGSGIV